MNPPKKYLRDWTMLYKSYNFTVVVYSYRDAKPIREIVEEICEKNKVKMFLNNIYVSSQLDQKHDSISQEIQDWADSQRGKRFKYQLLSGVLLKNFPLRAHLNRYFKDHHIKGFVYSGDVAEYRLWWNIHQRKDFKKLLKKLDIVPAEYRDQLDWP
jgi:methionine salvage enolase-phosphatase E1